MKIGFYEPLFGHNPAPVTSTLATRWGRYPVRPAPNPDRAAVLAFLQWRTIRALLAELLGLVDVEIMRLDVPNGGAFLFVRSFDAAGNATYVEQSLSKHVLPKEVADIAPPPVA